MDKGKRKQFKIDEFICTTGLIVMLIVSTWQIILRYVFKSSNTWSDEVARYLYIMLIYIGAGYAVIKDTHIRIETAPRIFPEKIRKYIVLLGDFVLIILSIFLTYQSGRYTINLYIGQQMSVGLKIKMAYVYSVIPIGFILFTIRLIQYDFLNKAKELFGEG